MRLAVLVLVAASTGLAVAGAAVALPWTFSLPAGLVAGLWIGLAVWRPSSRLHVLPALLCVGTSAALTLGAEARILGLAALPLALFAWDATYTLRSMSRFAARVRLAAVLRYAAAVSAISAATIAVAVGGNLLPLRLSFPIALGVSTVLLGLSIGVLLVARRSSTVAPLDEEVGKEEGDAAPEGDASPSYQPRGFKP